MKLLTNTFIRSVFLLLLFALIWQIIHFAFLSQYFLPSTFVVVRVLSVSLISGELLQHAAASLQRVLVGFFIAAVFGISLGIISGSVDTVGKLIKPFIEILRPIPPIAWIPIAILVFGLGDTSAYFIVFLGAFFPIFTNTHFGAGSVPVIYRNIAGSFEMHSYMWRVVFFYALPSIFTGLKIGVGMAWMSVIAAELIGAQTGLGYFIQINRLLLRTDNIVAGMIVIGVIGAVLVFLVSWLEKIVMPWRK